MRCHHVIAAHVLDVQKFIFCCHLGQWNDLDTIFFPVGGVHKQVAKITWSFGAFHCLADIVHILLILRCVSHVHDEACMAAVDVILPAK